ncbi:MAG: hypothetical protein IPI67_36970 [Myxococcales bacterium]|nr:hypothetical protein [Myxococcales bacterium]
MRRVGALIAVLATIAACSGEESDATCPGNGGTECAKHCGSDAVAEGWHR